MPATTCRDMGNRRRRVNVNNDVRADLRGNLDKLDQNLDYNRKKSQEK